LNCANECVFLSEEGRGQAYIHCVPLRVNFF
jgi:hypothetical protein